MQMKDLVNISCMVKVTYKDLVNWYDGTITGLDYDQDGNPITIHLQYNNIKKTINPKFINNNMISKGRYGTMEVFLNE